MKRTAILVGAKSGDATGVQHDLNHWHSFLVSPIGGAWLDRQEIHILSNPSESNITDLVRLSASDDYVVVVFLGHGELRKDRLGFPETFISLPGLGSISERELNPRNDRCSIFIDLGRNALARMASATQSQKSDENRLPRSRELFDSEIAKSEKGCVKIYAENLSPEAQPENSFSATLINQSIEWAQRDYGTLDLHRAMALTCDQFKRSHLPQGPRYQGGRRLRHFPFAVNPKD